MNGPNRIEMQTCVCAQSISGSGLKVLQTTSQQHQEERFSHTRLSSEFSVFISTTPVLKMLQFCGCLVEIYEAFSEEDIARTGAYVILNPVYMFFCTDGAFQDF